MIWDPCPRPVGQGNRSKITEGPVFRSFSYGKQSWEFFSLFWIATSWLVPSAGQKIPVQPGWYLPLQKNLLAGNKFIQAGKGAENRKEKSRQCFMASKQIKMVREVLNYLINLHWVSQSGSNCFFCTFISAKNIYKKTGPGMTLRKV
jgi:hypothetical protein